jgi:hypothetical protein
MSKELKQVKKVREKYEAMDQSKKKELLAKNMNYKKTMSKEQSKKCWRIKK